MFYKQSITGVKIVVLTLDGGLLDLNRLRYNYYKRLCKHYDKSINKYEFSESLGNMHTMYKNSPIQDYKSNAELNELVEKDLFSYAKLKPDLHKDGIEELLQFFMQRNIKVVVVSTHKTKRAIQYLQLARLHKYIDFVIGGDSDCAPLPDAAILDLIQKQMQVAISEVLVVANFPTMVIAANTLLMNVVYVPDLAPATATIEASVYRVAKNPLEIINLFLFAKYDTVEMFSPLLGMSATMDATTLRKTYEALLKEYADDENLIQLVNQTYQYLMLEIQDKDTRKRIEKQSFLFKDDDFEDDEEVLEGSNIEEIPMSHNGDMSNNNTTPLFSESIEEDVEEEQEIDVEDQSVMQAKALQKDFVTQATSLNLMMDAINEKGTSVDTTTDEEINDEVQDTEDSTLKVVWSYIVDFIYTFILAIIIVLIGMMLHIVTVDFLSSQGILPTILKAIVDGYIGLITLLYRIIFNGLHTVFSFIPNYDSLLTGSTMVSETAMETILYIIFHLGLIYLIRWLWSKYKNVEPKSL